MIKNTEARITSNYNFVLNQLEKIEDEQEQDLLQRKETKSIEESKKKEKTKQVKDKQSVQQKFDVIIQKYEDRLSKLEKRFADLKTNVKSMQVEAEFQTMEFSLKNLHSILDKEKESAKLYLQYVSNPNLQFISNDLDMSFSQVADSLYKLELRNK